MTQVTTDGGGFYDLNASTNSAEDKALFALPIVVGILGAIEFCIVGILLLYYYSKNSQVNSTPYSCIIAPGRLI